MTPKPCGLFMKRIPNQIETRLQPENTQLASVLKQFLFHVLPTYIIILFTEVGAEGIFAEHLANLVIRRLRFAL